MTSSSGLRSKTGFKVSNNKVSNNTASAFEDPWDARSNR